MFVLALCGVLGFVGFGCLFGGWLFVDWLFGLVYFGLGLTVCRCYLVLVVWFEIVLFAFRFVL